MFRNTTLEITVLTTLSKHSFRSLGLDAARARWTGRAQPARVPPAPPSSRRLLAVSALRPSRPISRDTPATHTSGPLVRTSMSPGVALFSGSAGAVPVIPAVTVSLVSRAGPAGGAAGTGAMWSCAGYYRRVVTSRRLRPWVPGRFPGVPGAAGASVPGGAGCARPSRPRVPAALTRKSRTHATSMRLGCASSGGMAWPPCRALACGPPRHADR